MMTPYSTLLEETIVPVAGAFGYALVENEYDDAEFGNAIVAFTGPRARAVLIKDRSFWSFHFSDKTGALEDIEIAEWIEIIDGKAGDQWSWRGSYQADSEQLSQLARRWKEYGAKIEELLAPHRISLVQLELIPLRKRRVDELLKPAKKEG